MTVKLYYSPGSCSLAAHIVARETGLPVDIAKVDLRAKQIDGGGDYRKINPKGYVPALVLDDGEVLTEVAVVSQYLADKAPHKHLAPANGTLPRYRVQEWLSYIGAELHKSFSPLFNPTTPDDMRENRKAYLQMRYVFVDEQLAKGPVLVGEHFSVADAYLFVVTSWATPMGLDLSAFRNLNDFQKRVAARPAVRQAMREQGLLAD